MPTSKRSTTSRTPRKRASAGGGGSSPEPAPGGFGHPELIVVAEAGAALRVTAEGATSLGGADTRGLDAVASRADVTITPLFGPEERVLREVAEAAAVGAAVGGAPMPDLSVFYHVDAPESRLDELAEELASLEGVAAAYVKPPGEPPELNDMTPAPEDAPPATPDFVARQLYLEAAPGGIDARYAWNWPGGRGDGVSVIDCEWGWRFDHEDLTATQGGVVVGTAGTDTNHGTAVIGEISGDVNTFGITGICPNALISAAAFSGPTATTIREAAQRLGAGDIILLEIHRAGPRHNFQGRQDQLGYIAIEWWPDDFAAIQFATSLGIIVVEAAGNGAEDLDDAIYSVRPPGFPVTWTNPFNRANRDSGAVVVGAGAPPPGTHGRTHGADRSRLGFSNYGALIDAQAWGREVTSTGYGDLQGGADARFWYTDQFSGTSSASPIVVGALGSLQGALRAAGKPAMTPAKARAWLRATGSPQQDEPGRPATQRIGNRPDLRQLIQAHVKGTILSDKITVKEAKREKVEVKDVKDVRKDKSEKLEIKDAKTEKAEAKDVKDVRKEKAEKVEVKEKEKVEKLERKEKIEIFEHGPAPMAKATDKSYVVDHSPTPEGGIGGYYTALVELATSWALHDLRRESSRDVGDVAHFIDPSLRPDLGAGALAREADLYAQSAGAKDDKDLKDKENLAES